ncbi:MAG: glycoside hydrolase family 127 protein [Vicinamibacterales bacterium]
MPAALAVAAAGCAREAGVPAEAVRGAGSGGMSAADAARDAAPAVPAAMRLEPFDYDGVRLLDSQWQRQMAAGRDYYRAIPDDDILHGCRAEAGLDAPGRPLGGWCGVNSNSVLGQWLSGMSRLARATGDDAIRAKAVRLFVEWAKTIGSDGDPHMRHYAYDKLVCGLVDLRLSADYRPAEAVLGRVTDFAAREFERPQLPLSDKNHNQHYYGLPQEWYTLGENLFRAFRMTGDERYRRFAEEWLYHAYWAKFEATASPADAHGLHAYSHTNAFSSAAMAYEVLGDVKYLTVARNGYDYLQRHQCYATGGYGPNERYMAPDGSLGRALETRSDTCETSCGAWAGFKLSRYLIQFTGEARYGDWIERLFYNAIGAALPVTAPGRNFYYSDYRVGGGMKVYNWDTYTCCSGTYLQNLAEYHNLIYFRDPQALYVNLFVPSEVVWRRDAGDVRVRQETAYPDGEVTTLTVTPAAPAAFAIRFRVPGWARGVAVRVNGDPVAVEAVPGRWAEVTREWRGGDRLEITLPLALRMEAVDAQHPDRVAVVRGPVVHVLEGAYHDPHFRLPLTDAELTTWLVAEPGGLPRGEWATGLPERTWATNFRVAPPDGSAVRLRFRPFYEIQENYPYFMYFDRRQGAVALW